MSGDRHRRAAPLVSILIPLFFLGCEQSRTPAGPSPTSAPTAAAHPENPDESLDQAQSTPLTSVSQGNSAKKLDIAVCDPARGGFNASSTNVYFPMPVGKRWVYEGDEDGEHIRLEITVLDVTEVVAGVTTRVIEERETVDGELVEVSRNYFAQASDASICYFGEAVDIYEGDAILHTGSWRADEPGSHAGIFMPANPRPGMEFQMEIAPGVAMDEGRIVGIGPVSVPAGGFAQTIRVREFNPLDGEKDYKVFAAGIGLVIDGPVELISF